MHRHKQAHPGAVPSMGDGRRQTCRVHGSATKRSARAAEKVIAESKGYAAEMLVEFMADPHVDIKHRIQIAQDLLTRANVSGKTMVEIDRYDFYANVIEASTIPVDEHDDLDGPLIIDAVVVEDDPEEDERIIARDRAIQKRARQGEQPELPAVSGSQLRHHGRPARPTGVRVAECRVAGRVRGRAAGEGGAEEEARSEPDATEPAVSANSHELARNDRTTQGWGNSPSQRKFCRLHRILSAA